MEAGEDAPVEIVAVLSEATEIAEGPEVAEATEITEATEVAEAAEASPSYLSRSTNMIGHYLSSFGAKTPTLVSVAV